MNKAEITIRGLLELADIEINGNNPHDVQVNDTAFYRRVLSGGPLGLGEAYMDGLWDCEALDDFISREAAKFSEQNGIALPSDD